jgi:hypothetical protein
MEKNIWKIELNLLFFTSFDGGTDQFVPAFKFINNN